MIKTAPIINNKNATQVQGTWVSKIVPTDGQFLKYVETLKSLVYATIGISDVDGLIAALSAKTPNPSYDYRDMMIKGCDVPDTNPASVEYEETATNKQMLAYGLFTKAGENTENLQWQIPFPDDWNSADGTLGKIQFSFYWRPVSGTDDVKWQVAGKLLPDGDPVDVTLATIGVVEDTIQNTTDMHVTSYTAAAVVTSASGGGDFALLSVTRQAPAGTDCNGDIKLYRVKIKFIRTLA